MVDLVSCLRVLHDPAAGSELIRLMVGARWRVGVHDVAALRGVSSWLFGHDHAQQVLSDEATAGFRASVAPGEHGSIVDALDFVTTAPLGHRQLEAFSPEGLLRLRRLGAQLAFLRSRTGLDLVDLVTVVQQEMLLDVEVAAATGAVHGGAWLQAFDDELSGYVATDENASLGGFLSWLSAAERRDDMGPRSEAGERGTVQLLTIHGSKGLEWDVVGVPRLVEGELPGTSRAGAGWLGFGELPYEFRGDAAELPDLGWRGVDDQKDFDRRLAAFKDELVARHLAEERRLAYVAFTRAKDDLLLTGSFWSSTIKPRAASRYLRDLVDAGLVAAEDVPEAPADEENPWPTSPGSSRGPSIRWVLGESPSSRPRAASRVRSPSGETRSGPRRTTRRRRGRPTSTSCCSNATPSASERGRSRCPSASRRPGSRTTSTIPRRWPPLSAVRCPSGPIGPPGSAPCSTSGSRRGTGRPDAPRCSTPSTPRRTSTMSASAAPPDSSIPTTPGGSSSCRRPSSGPNGRSANRSTWSSRCICRSADAP
nr:hypothetical protein GCM10025699_60070 [Microbacterium flavescens]